MEPGHSVDSERCNDERRRWAGRRRGYTCRPAGARGLRCRRVLVSQGLASRSTDFRRPSLPQRADEVAGGGNRPATCSSCHGLLSTLEEVVLLATEARRHLQCHTLARATVTHGSTRSFLSSARASLLKCIDQRSYGELLAGYAWTIERSGVRSVTTVLKESRERGTRKIGYRTGQPRSV